MCLLTLSRISVAVMCVVLRLAVVISVLVLVGLLVSVCSMCEVLSLWMGIALGVLLALILVRCVVTVRFRWRVNGVSVVSILVVLLIRAVLLWTS